MSNIKMILNCQKCTTKIVTLAILGVSLLGHIAFGQDPGSSSGSLESQPKVDSGIETEAAVESAPEVKTPLPTSTPATKMAAPIQPSAASNPAKEKPSDVAFPVPLIDYHEATPASLKNRLLVGANLGLGWGKSNLQSDAADHLSMGAHVSYLFGESASAPNPSSSSLSWLAEVNYLSLTGVNAKLDESFVAQSFSLGGGLHFGLKGFVPDTKESADQNPRIFASERMAFQAVLLGGLSKRNANAQATGRSIKTKFAPDLGFEGRYLYRIWHRFNGFAGVGVRAIGYTWVDAKLGVLCSF